MYNHLAAVRQGRYKLHFFMYDENKGRYWDQKNWDTLKKPVLYDLEVDPGERFDIADEHPDAVARLSKAAEDYKAEIDRLDENAELKNYLIEKYKMK